MADFQVENCCQHLTSLSRRLVGDCLMNNRAVRQSIFALAILSALAVRLRVWWSLSGIEGGFVKPDTMSYLEPGLQFLESASFSSIMRTPVYPIFLASVYELISTDPAIIALTQIVLSVATIMLVFYIARRIFGFAVAILASFFMALDLTSVFLANYLLSETLFTFILVCCLLGLLHLGEEWKIDLRLALVGIGFGILTLCRPVAMFLSIFVSLWLYIVINYAGLRRLALVAVFVICAVSLPALWMVKNYSQTGTLFLTTISSVNMYEYRAALNVSRIENRPFEEVKEDFTRAAKRVQVKEGLSDAQLANWMARRGMHVLLEHPIYTAQQFVEGMARMYLGISDASIRSLFQSGDVRSFRESSWISVSRFSPEAAGLWHWLTGLRLWAVIYLMITYLGVGFVILGLLKGKFHRSRQAEFVWLMLVVIAYFTLLSSGAETYSRFRVPLMPALAMLSAAGWVIAAERWRLFRSNSAEGSVGLLKTGG